MPPPPRVSPPPPLFDSCCGPASCVPIDLRLEPVFIITAANPAPTPVLLTARNQKIREKLLLSISSFVQAARNNVLLAVPAFLYAINNYLKFTMQLYYDPATVKMLSNLKVLVIAVLLKIIMKRRFSIIQWEALALLLIGISVNQMRSLPEGSTAMGLPVAVGAYIYTFIFVSWFIILCQLIYTI